MESLITDAIRCTRCEQDRLHAEIAALDDFRKELGNLNGSGAATTGLASATVLEAAGTESLPSIESSSIKSAFERTLMAVPHFESEFGELFYECFAEEFDPRLAVAIESNIQLPLEILNVLDTRTQVLIASRKRMSEECGRERDNLREHCSTIQDIRTELFAIESRPFLECTRDELDALADDLECLEEQCDSLIEKRQTELADQRRALQFPADQPHVQPFIYQSLSVNYPVLSQIATLSDEIVKTSSKVTTIVRGLSSP